MSILALTQSLVMFLYLVQHSTQRIAPQGRQPNFQPHYDVPRNNHTDDSVRKFKLDAPKFDGMIESTTFLD